MLAVLLPMTLPTAIPGDPASADWMLVTSSGVEVPNPTVVNPITKGETASRCAAATAPPTSISTPKRRQANPTRIKIAFTSDLPG